MIGFSHSEERLDRNELPWDLPLNFKLQAIAKLLRTRWNHYPALEQSRVKTSLARRMNVHEQNIILSAGATPFIETFFLKFISQSSIYIQGDPSYFRYHSIAKSIGARAIFFNFSRNPNNKDALINSVKAHPEAPIILTSPNNPTGHCFHPDLLFELPKHTKAPILLDLTYHWFSEQHPTEMSARLLEFENVIQLYSLSKAFGTAGVRLGFSIVQPALAASIEQVFQPCPLNHFSQAVLETLLQDKWWSYGLQKVNIIISNRKKLIQHLEQISWIKVYPSDANFVLIESKTHIEKIHTQLRQNGFLTKVISPQQLRITVGKKNICKAVFKIINGINS